MLPEVGVEGQKKICAASVLCIGAGGLGSPAALYLAAAGVGKLGLVDFDVVDESNLQRQLLHGSADVGRKKTESARETIRRLNPGVEVVAHDLKLAAANVREVFEQYDVIVDGTDNFPTRYLANDACVFLRKPYIYGAILRFEGQASVFAPHLGAPCYRCLFPEPPGPGMAPSCAEAGVLGVLPGIIGTIQATETLKLILCAGTSLLNRLLLFDALEMKFSELKLRRDPQCALCGEKPTITSLTDSAASCSVPNMAEPDPDEVTVQDMKRALDDPALGIQVIDVREQDEHDFAHVQGTGLVPLSQFAQRFKEFKPEQSYYLYCKVGGRSLRAVYFLRQQGFKDVKSVRGGIDAWSREIDPTMPRY